MQTRLGSALGASVPMSLAIASTSIAQTGTISGRATSSGRRRTSSRRSDHRSGNTRGPN